jgi:hypothetical protein
MTTIIGLSGKKQSGKDTLLLNLTPHFRGITKKYSFADGLKNFLVDVMGLEPDQVWGTDEQKNSLTQYAWESIPEYIRWENGGRWVRYKEGNFFHQLPLLETKISCNEVSVESFFWNIKNSISVEPVRMKSGQMKARELMQVFGTDVSRRMFSQLIWVDATFRAIKKDNPDFAIITDVRFPSEINSVLNSGGIVVRLTRNILFDEHPSETALDDYNWDSCNKKSIIIVPGNLNAEETKNYVWGNLSSRLEINL